MNLDLGPIPLYWRTRMSREDINAFPDHFPFAFEYNSTTGLINEKITPELQQLLRKIYQADANIGYLQDGHDLATGYGDDFFRFIKESLQFIRHKSDFNTLELGCGGCYTLRQLRDSGVQAEGMDPSPVAQRAAQRYDLKVIEGFFPEAAKAGNYDLIYHMDVLEHVENPIQFLLEHRKILRDEGWVLISLPDCTSSIQIGDLGMVIHQHISFFDEVSLRNTLLSVGFEPICIERARIGGSLYCLAKKSAATTLPLVPVGANRFAGFQKSARAGIATFKQFIDIGRQPNRSVGVYVPLRALSYFGICGLQREVRLFDDDRGLHGRWLDGYDVPVESFQDLEQNPVSDMLVMSLSFGDKIKEKIHKRFGDNIRVKTLKELFMD